MWSIKKIECLKRYWRELKKDSVESMELKMDINCIEQWLRESKKLKGLLDEMEIKHYEKIEKGE